MTTSITFHLRPSQAVGRQPGKLFIRVIRARQSRHISRNYSVYEDEWDSENKKLIFPSPETDSERNRQLAQIDESMKSDLSRLQEIVSLLSAGGDFTVADVANRFTDSMNSNTVWGFAEIAGNRLREIGRERTARAYRSAARTFRAFNGGKDTLLSEIDASLIASYESFLISSGLKMNTVSFYLRNLRAIYFRAVAERMIPRQSINPFNGVHTGVYETKRRALDDCQLRALAKLDEILSDIPPEETDDDAYKNRKKSELRDSLLYFMFCYHARGMSFVDMANLRKEDVNIGAEVLTYRRRKTRGLLEIKITEPMSKIISYFSSRTEHSDYLFPVIDSSKGRLHLQYESGLKRQNRLLKTLAQMAGITENLSTHAARHTWATLAKRLHVPVAVIGEALGHRDVKTTSIYLASFDRETMDELSKRLSDAIWAA